MTPKPSISRPRWSRPPPSPVSQADRVSRVHVVEAVVLGAHVAQRELRAVAQEQERVHLCARAEAEVAGHVHHGEAPLADVLEALGREGFVQVDLPGQYAGGAGADDAAHLGAHGRQRLEVAVPACHAQPGGLPVRVGRIAQPLAYDAGVDRQVPALQGVALAVVQRAERQVAQHPVQGEHHRLGAGLLQILLHGSEQQLVQGLGCGQRIGLQGRAAAG
jgi:hypothetical protein